MNAVELNSFINHNRIVFMLLAAFLFICSLYNGSWYYVAFAVLSLYISFVCDLMLKKS